ncbi:hypothetical protein CEXT_13261 [Caerostris extrusa]|uniref:Uncharacterized protein n=1 Tax=Caerostris extrusa TaxID=172846 RepID=A0AAV4P525_CAEEX|nr:hypothetical protein CEXT_13261 [Caerostris extrusa]
MGSQIAGAGEGRHGVGGDSTRNRLYVVEKLSRLAQPRERQKTNTASPNQNTPCIYVQYMIQFLLEGIDFIPNPSELLPKIPQHLGKFRPSARVTKLISMPDLADPMTSPTGHDSATPGDYRPIPIAC